MRIGYDAKRLFSNFTGLGNYSRTLVQRIYQQYPQNQYFLYSPKITKHRRTNYFLDNQFKVISPKFGFKNIWRQTGIAKRFSKDQLDIYHGLSAELPQIPKQTNTKTVVTIHDLLWRTFPKQYAAVDRNIYDKKAKYACQQADQIIAISQQTKRDIIASYGIDEEKVEVIYQGYSPIFDHLHTTEERESITTAHGLPKQYLLYVGSIIERKNVLKILKALPFLKGVPPLVIIGGGSGRYYNSVKHLSNKLGKQVIWLKDVPFSQFPAIYQGAAMMIYPSIAEGFGIPIVEALASETPVITSNHSCLPEAAGQESIRLDVVEPETIAQAIDRLLVDSSKRKRMIAAGKTHVKKFSNEQHAKHVMFTYRQMLQ